MAKTRSVEETAIIVAMRAKYAENDRVTFDDNAKIEFAEGGAWVKGWLWYEDKLMRRDLDDDEWFASFRREHEASRVQADAERPITPLAPLFRFPASGRVFDGKRILALDLKQQAAWAVRAADTGICHGSYDVCSWRFRNWIATICCEGDIEAVHFIEGTTFAHREWLAHLEKACVGAGVPLRGVKPGAVKKHITGKGVAPAAAVLEAVERLGYEPGDESEAMAIGLLLLAEQPAQRKKGKAA